MEQEERRLANVGTERVVDSNKISIRLPAYLLTVLASSAVALLGAALTVWNNSTLHSTQISILMRDQDRLTVQMQTLENAMHAQSVKVAKIERESTEFNDAALEKLDEIIQTDAEHRAKKRR